MTKDRGKKNQISELKIIVNTHVFNRVFEGCKLNTKTKLM